VLKAGEAQPGASVRIEPRAHVDRYELAGEGEPETLSELHDSLRLDPEAATAQRTAERILAEARAQRESMLANLDVEARQAREGMERELAMLQEAAELELVEQRVQLQDNLRAELDREYQARYGAALAQLEQAAAQLAQCQAEYLKEIEAPALELVLAIARQLLAGELAHSPQVLARLIAEGLQLLQPQQTVQVALCPDTLELLTHDELLGSVLRERGLALERVELSGNPALAPDQFVLQAGAARVSFDLNAKAAELVAQLTQRAAAEARQA
jgi:flagellar biosynthesis/type III secretory pathway protein FliH